MRDAAGQLVKGVTVGDMGDKTIGNDLDNAWIQVWGQQRKKGMDAVLACWLRKGKVHK